MADEQPEGGAPEGGASPQGAAPEPEAQVKPWWEARGFKNEEDALNALDEGRRALTETQTKLATMESTLKVLMEAKPAATAEPKKETPGYRRYFDGMDVQGAYASGDPYQLVEVIAAGLDRMSREQAEAIVARQLEARELRETFYRDNSDLKPHEELVKFVSQQFASENPNMTVKAAYGEIAKRVRAKIAEIKKGGSVQVGDAPGDGKPPKDALPHTGAGGLGEGGGDAPPAKKPAERDDVTSEVSRRVAEREKRRVLR